MSTKMTIINKEKFNKDCRSCKNSCNNRTAGGLCDTTPCKWEKAQKRCVFCVHFPGSYDTIKEEAKLPHIHCDNFSCENRQGKNPDWALECKDYKEVPSLADTVNFRKEISEQAKQAMGRTRGISNSAFLGHQMGLSYPTWYPSPSMGFDWGTPTDKKNGIPLTKAEPAKKTLSPQEIYEAMIKDTEAKVKKLVDAISGNTYTFGKFVKRHKNKKCGKLIKNIGMKMYDDICYLKQPEILNHALENVERWKDMYYEDKMNELEGTKKKRCECGAKIKSTFCAKCGKRF